MSDNDKIPSGLEDCLTGFEEYLRGDNFSPETINFAGYSIAEAAQQAGHASPRVTMRYIHPDRKAMIEKANKL